MLDPTEWSTAGDAGVTTDQRAERGPTQRRALLRRPHHPVRRPHLLRGGHPLRGALPDFSPERGLRYSRIYTPRATAARSPASAPRWAAGRRQLPRIARRREVVPHQPAATRRARADLRRIPLFAAEGTGVPSPTCRSSCSTPKIGTLNPTQQPLHRAHPARGWPGRHATDAGVHQPVPAAQAGPGRQRRRFRPIGGPVRRRGRVFLFNHEPGPSGGPRLLHGRPHPQPRRHPANERGEGSSGVLLFDGRMYTNGGHPGAGSRNVYFYDPYANSWANTPRSTPPSRACTATPSSSPTARS